MSENQALLCRDDSTLQIVITSEAHALKQAALECASLIAKVSTPAQQEAAVAAQTELRRVIALTEKSRVEIKAPVLDYGRRIDQAAKMFIDEVKAEELRVAALVGDYQTAEQARLRSLQAARFAELSELERRREEELSQAATHDDRDAIQARYNEEAAAVCNSIPQATKADGQVIREDFEIAVEDAAILARMHYPELCKVEPRIGPIKEALRAGRKVYGIKAAPIVKSGVRLTKEKAIEA